MAVKPSRFLGVVVSAVELSVKPKCRKLAGLAQVHCRISGGITTQRCSFVNNVPFLKPSFAAEIIDVTRDACLLQCTLNFKKTHSLAYFIEIGVRLRTVGDNDSSFTLQCIRRHVRHCANDSPMGNYLLPLTGARRVRLTNHIGFQDHAVARLDDLRQGIDSPKTGQLKYSPKGGLYLPIIGSAPEHTHSW